MTIIMETNRNSKINILFAQNEAAFNAAKNKEVDVSAVPLAYAKKMLTDTICAS